MLGYGNISLDLLLPYAMGLDLFDRIDSLEQARNRLLALVEILKASSLLLDSHEDRDKFVRMHDVVCNVVREIASKDPHPFVVREDVGLEEWSETDESKSYTFISLHCKAVHELPQGLVCPDLQFFQLHNNNPSLNIPNTFFEGMKKLKVLDLSKMRFTVLPSSLDSLTNLQTLRLDGCKLEDIALIGKLTKLEVLSLMGSTIQQLPNEMVQLTNLRLLDLNDCKELEVIPQNILSSLSRLECLYMKSSFTQWAVEGESNACLSELNHLSHLTTLEIDIPNAKLLPKDILFENLTRYGIFIGVSGGLRTKRALNLYEVNRSLHLGDGMSKLLERSEELQFYKLSGTKYVLYPSDRESFRELKHLQVFNSPEIQYIIDSKDQWFLQHGAFPLLESLILMKLENLEEVWHGPIPIESFGNLKTLNVYSCPKLKFLFLLSTARGLPQLEEMTIEYCVAMQQIIAYKRESEIQEDGHGGTNLQLFPKLRSLILYDLPQLINFSSELETTSSTSLSTNARSEDSFFSHKVSFPKLEELTLKYLPKLKDIWHHQLPFESFSNLQILRVYECPCLLNLVPTHLIHNFQNLKEIDVQDCELLEHVNILQENDGNVEIFSKLETLKLKKLPRLRWMEDGNDRMKHISSLMTLMNIQNLQELHISDCSMEDLRKM
ncbi:disease resistance protein At4g27190-like [Vitis vinifera]|nr:disease resistance protein At4g27190-like [Vitis vinifera]|eukprot:XP_010659963.1 PREDICTED: disease resistance protein At4g27190-like [Vitis vinifera]